MRSHDYCHFEVALSHNGTLEESVLTPEQVDDLRKKAARLADKAVEQYKVAKEVAERAMSQHWEMDRLVGAALRIVGVAENDRTPEEKATLKAYEDAKFRTNRRYGYEDDWQDETDYDDVA